MGANAHPFFLEIEMDATTYRRPFNVNEIEDGIKDIISNAQEGQDAHDIFRPRPSSQRLARGENGGGVNGDISSRPEDVAEVVQAHDSINHPSHYTAHPSGVECITITEHMNFCRGNAIKYIWRVDEKGDPIENLKKAIWYLNREIERLSK